MAIKYATTKDGSPELVDTKHIFREQCCDCGLVHKLKYKIIDGHTIEVTCWRDDKETNRIRKKSFKQKLKLLKRIKKVRWLHTRLKWQENLLTH